MTRERLPASFPSEERAREWAAHLAHEVVAIKPYPGKPGRWQVTIDRRAKVDE